MKTIGKYWKVWWLMSRNSFLAILHVKIALSIFLTGKILRFVFFILFLIFLVKGTKGLAGYTVEEVVFFFLTFNIIDITAQFFFREVYRFRPLVVSGDFDLVLVKPVNALFRVLMGGADLIDLITLPPLVGVLVYVGYQLHPNGFLVVSYLLLITNGLLLAAAFHILVLALGIITFEIDHTIMIYRDLIALGRLPVDIYRQPLRSFLTFVIPVGVMMTLPAKALMGLASPVGVVVSLAAGIIAVLISLRFWHYALKRYSSASS